MAEDNSKRTIIPDEEADLEVTSYEVLPGITLIYNVVHMQKGCINVPCSGNIYEINHCSICRHHDITIYHVPEDLSGQEEDAGDDEEVRDKEHLAERHRPVFVHDERDDVSAAGAAALAD